ncbi:MFS transporter [Achromobacter pestifer]|uniref:Proline/betaine transporter n=1 Tax=Achromobacter pestifer TaxID=1353889 RepID=A0A6S6YTZ5_9BURK|nr:MFS transporter [Achromobacter pestifer]CAB3637689.1 Proline/betaine transporter [Achromobacter pestifer]
MPSHCPPTYEVSANMRRRVVIASVLGNAFEWFDFAIYGMFAAVISRLYFPAADNAKSLLLGLATFGVAFAVRPIGGLVLGIYADRHGRRRALSLMILMMAGGTAMIGVLPTYASIGMAASVLMLVARLIQGFSVGGEYASASAMLVEFAPKGRRGLYGSFQMCSQSLAFSAGAGVVYLLSSNLSTADLESWGWRVPFLFGMLIGPIGFYLRTQVDETPEFRRFQDQRIKPERTTLRTLFTRYPRELIGSFCLVVTGTASNYVMLLYLPIYAVQELGLTMGDAQLSSALAGALLLVLCPISGALSDKLSRRALILPATVAFGVVTWIMLARVLQNPGFSTLLQAQLLAAACMGFMWGPTPALTTEILPVNLRSTGVSLSYNLGVMLFGGLAPFINTALIQYTGNRMVPAYYVMVAVVIGLGGLLLLGNRVRPPGDELTPALQRP